MVPSQQDAPKVTNLPKSNLHEMDVKFISETVKVVSNIDGANEMKLRVHDRLPSVFSLSVTRPPKMRPDDLRQLQMLTTRLKRIRFNFSANKLLIECWKHKREPTEKKRQREEDDLFTIQALPENYNLEMVDKMDLKHVEGIISFMVQHTDLEFDIDIHTDVSNYRLLLSNLEIFEIKLIENLIKKYGAFISQIYFDFPKGVLELGVRRNDSPLDSIATVRPRKKVKVSK